MSTGRSADRAAENDSLQSRMQRAEAMKNDSRNKVKERQDRSDVGNNTAPATSRESFSQRNTNRTGGDSE
jgi:hypothetical protein